MVLYRKLGQSDRKFSLCKFEMKIYTNETTKMGLLTLKTDQSYLTAMFSLFS